MIIAPQKHEDYFNSIINFGSKTSKVKEVVNKGFNAKFSEYDAAILMANFDYINKFKIQIKKNLQYIIRNLAKEKKIGNNKEGSGATHNRYINFQPHLSQTWLSLKLSVITNKKINFNKLYKKIQSSFKINIYRAWSPKPMHKHIFFKKFKKSLLVNTNYISNRIFFLPFNIDYKKKELNRLVVLLKSFPNK